MHLHGVAAAVALVGTIAFSQTAPRTITVYGNGTVAAAPDQLRLSMQVAVRAENASKAMSATSRKTSELIAVLTAGGVAAKDIQTSRISVTQIVDYSRNIQPPPVIGYQGLNELSVLFRGKAMELTGECIDRAAGSGAITFGGMVFESSKQQECEREALKSAFADARARAEALATECRVKLGRVMSVSESVGAPSVSSRSAKMMAGAQDAAPPVMPGEVSVTAQVTVVFELE